MLNYETAAVATSETDDETPVCSDGDGAEREKDPGGPAAGVPSPVASPRMGHALLCLEAEVLHQHWSLGDIDDTDAHRRRSGRSHDLKSPGEITPLLIRGLKRTEEALGAGPRQDITTCSLFIGQVAKRRGLEVLVQSQWDMPQVSPSPEWRLHVNTPRANM